ncbi:MAG: CHAT domain-containing protein, partial [Bacteroidales bacterium]|nr:CHAT domain-containing protein [Bacteroidales bacterium]
ILYRLSTAYLIIGIIYFELGELQKSMESLKKSLSLRETYFLPDAGLTYLNLAKTYNRLNQPDEAEKYFKMSLASFDKEYGADYYRTAEVWFEYGKFLQSAGRDTEALDAHTRALAICRKVYGEKHPLTALAWKNLGDFFTIAGNFPDALGHYQKALIAISAGFTGGDITDNPEPASALFDIRLLEILKSKAAAFEKLSETQMVHAEKIKSLQNSLATVNIALNLLEQIRNSYITEENKMYLAENEKETYLQGVHTALRLYKLTDDKQYAGTMYTIAGRCKAAVLRSEIAGREFYFTTGLPDSLQEKQKNLARNLAAYIHLIIQESRQVNPDSNKISAWKDELFELNRQNEKLSQKIDSILPALNVLQQKTRPPEPSEIQKRLRPGETLIDYLISDHYENGRKNLYTFVITRKNFVCLESEVDSLFEINTGVIRNLLSPRGALLMNHDSFNTLIESLHFMYHALISDAEKYFSGRRLKIIPDGELSYLPFEAFIGEKTSVQPGFENLDFLIHRYVFSYNYSSSLFHEKEERKFIKDLYAFIPSYGCDTCESEVSSLEGAGRELDKAYRYFKGRIYAGNEAGRAGFRDVLGSGAILHLAMHSVADTVDSRFSYLLFSGQPDYNVRPELFSYEISLSRVVSPLVVLSACNSGSGPLNRTEGTLSIARSFVLAGASSVIRTSWDINDETSSEIISSFYNHLAKGKRKDDALRQAKIDYLRVKSPVLQNPYYWAAYEITGDTGSVTGNKKYLTLQVLLIIIIVSVLSFYLRRRRILRALSR